MRDVSQRWKDSIGSVNRWATEVEWSNDNFAYTGGTARLESGSVTQDSTAQVRWTCSLVLHDAPFGKDGINPFTTRIRIRHGLAYSRTQSELLSLGAYKVMTTSRSRAENGLTITGDSYERFLLNARLRKPWKAPAGSAESRLDRLIHSVKVLASAPIVWDGVASVWLPSTLIERDRWDAIDGSTGSTSIARTVGGRIFADPQGAFVVRPVPSLEDPTSWAAQAGPGGVLVNSTEELTNENTYNEVIANGESTDGETPAVGPGISADTDPLSLTFIDGEFGEKTYFYTSQLLTTLTQCKKTAASMLAPLLGLRQQITFDSLHDPSKEAGDVGLVTGVDGQDERVILDSVTYDLLGGPLQANTRTTQTRLAGDQAEAPDDTGESEAA